MLTTKTIAYAIASLGALLALSLSTHAAFTMIENFESYDSSEQLSAAWPSTVGAPVISLENGSVCEGSKAMTFSYSGASAPFTNLVKLAFTASQDWSSNMVFNFNYGGNGNVNDDILVQFLNQNGSVLDSRRIVGGADASPCSQASLNLFGIAGLQSVRGIQIGVVAGGATNIGTVHFDNFMVGNRGVLSILGSSLALGVGSSGYDHNQYISGGSLSNGYAARLMMSQATNGWRVVNQSIGGDTTARVINRFNRDEVPVHADEVQIGLSLGNEGLPGAANPKAVFDQFYTGMTNLIAMSRANKILPLIGNQYPRNAYTPAEYTWLKKMDLLLNTLDVPSANFLGATDDGSGHWVNNSFINLLGTSDGIHPNDAGYYEMFLTIVPSVFDAVKMGKPTPHFESKNRFLRITGDETQTAPLSLNPSLIMHSFTVSFRVRSEATGTVASLTSETPAAHSTIEITSDDLAYVDASGTINHTGVSGTDGAWHDVVVTHSWARGVTWFYVDGVLSAKVSEQLAPVKFVLGGPGDAAARPGSPEQADYQNWLVHRSMMNAEEVNAQFHGHFQQASLELYAPLNDELLVHDGLATNQAQSLSIAAVNAASAKLQSVVSAESPADLIISTNDSPAVILNWTDPPTAEQDTYYVERSTADRAWANIAILPAHTATYMDSSVGRGTNYQYRVSFSKSGWRSDYALSEVVQFARTNLPAVSIDF